MSQKTEQHSIQRKSASLSGTVVRIAIALALAILGLSWPRVFSGQSAWVESHYSETVYQTIRRAISAVTSLLPCSIAELLLYAIVVGIPVLLIVRLVQLLLKTANWKRLLRTVSSILLAGTIVLNLFYVTWGLNYFREPLAQRLGLDVSTRPVEELEAFVWNTAKEASELRQLLPEDEQGVFAPTESMQSIFGKLPKSYAALASDYPAFEPDPTRVKPVLWSRGLSWQGIAGIYIGLTAEPNVNVDQPPLLLYQAAAHEMAHQMGIASENEAEFTAYLACRYSSDPAVRYSGLMNALILSGNALYKTDSARYLAATFAYGDAVWRDLEAYDAYWHMFDGEVRENADKRNDVYLKHNSQTSGILSYGESVDLMLAFAAKYGNLELENEGQTKN